MGVACIYLTVKPLSEGFNSIVKGVSMPIKDEKNRREYMRDYMYKYRRRNVGYAFVVGDLLHYGHLHFLKECNKHCDFLIVGIYTDKLTETYKRRPIIPFEERIELIQALKPVDMVVTVTNRNCTPMLKKLTEDGWKIKYLFHGTDWTAEIDDDLRKSKEFIESIGGELIQPRYYERTTTTSIIKEILWRYDNGENVVGKQKTLED